MNWRFVFFFNSVLLGVGLAMDAFSVSMANGLNEPKMKSGRISLIAGCYGFFQFAMPMIGWICVHTIVVYFQKFEKFIPWIALILLLYIGGKMLIEGIKGDDDENSDNWKESNTTIIFIKHKYDEKFINKKNIVKIYGKQYFRLRGYITEEGENSTNIISRILSYDLPIASNLINMSSCCRKA